MLSDKSSSAVDAWLNFWFGDSDSRVYALNRIAFAIVSLASLLNIWPERQMLLSTDGMIDLETVLGSIGNEYYFSVFHHLTSQNSVTICCVVAGVAMFALALGVLPRFAVLIIWVWHVSFSHRAFPALIGWDSLLRVYSFLILISPMGHEWSAGRSRRKIGKESPRKMVPKYGLQLMRIQLAVIYFDTVWGKINDEYWRNGEFLAYHMMSIYSRSPSDWLVNQPILSCLLTYSTLVIELAVPVLLYIKKTRWLGFFLGYSLHISIAIFSPLTIFSIAIMMAYLAFLDGDDIDRLCSWWKSLDLPARR